ncbi:unnamed protein product [Closterium sp. NIES-54]
MEVARTSMIHAAAPHFLWPFAVRYAAHQLNLWPRVSLPETSPTLRWTGKVGDASVFRGPGPSGVSQGDPLPGSVHVEEAAERVLRYLCSMSGMGLVLGGRGPVVLTGHADASWELRWLTYLLTDLGEQPRSPPVLYVDNKAMNALCQEHIMEHKTKHIALRYFLARELQQRGQIRLAYMATRANTADIFTKALPPGDHHRFSTVLGLVHTLPPLLSA